MLYVKVAGGFLLAYILGGIPFSLIVGLAVKNLDIRNYGSGNVGATNLARVCGRRYFVPGFCLDFGKGLAPVLILPPLLGFPEATSFLGTSFRLSLALAPVLGHIYSPFLNFRGGKGVATGAGAMAALFPLETAAAFLLWALVLALTGAVGVASCAGAFTLPIAFFLQSFLRQPPRATVQAVSGGLICTTLALLIIYRHKENLKHYFGERKQ